MIIKKANYYNEQKIKKCFKLYKAKRNGNWFYQNVDYALDIVYNLFYSRGRCYNE